jgi:hypothetical protein
MKQLLFTRSKLVLVRLFYPCFLYPIMTTIKTAQHNNSYPEKDQPIQLHDKPTVQRLSSGKRQRAVKNLIPLNPTKPPNNSRSLASTHPARTLGTGWPGWPSRLEPCNHTPYPPPSHHEHSLLKCVPTPTPTTTLSTTRHARHDHLTPTATKPRTRNLAHSFRLPPSLV